MLGWTKSSIPNFKPSIVTQRASVFRGRRREKEQAGMKSKGLRETTETTNI